MEDLKTFFAVHFFCGILGGFFSLFSMMDCFTTPFTEQQKLDCWREKNAVGYLCPTVGEISTCPCPSENKVSGCTLFFVGIGILSVSVLSCAVTPSLYHLFKKNCICGIPSFPRFRFHSCWKKKKEEEDLPAYEDTDFQSKK